MNLFPTLHEFAAAQLVQTCQKFNLWEFAAFFSNHYACGINWLLFLLQKLGQYNRMRRSLMAMNIIRFKFIRY